MPADCSHTRRLAAAGGTRSCSTASPAASALALPSSTGLLIPRVTFNCAM